MGLKESILRELSRPIQRRVSTAVLGEREWREACEVVADTLAVAANELAADHDIDVLRVQPTVDVLIEVFSQGDLIDWLLRHPLSADPFVLPDDTLEQCRYLLEALDPDTAPIPPPVLYERVRRKLPEALRLAASKPDSALSWHISFGRQDEAEDRLARLELGVRALLEHLSPPSLPVESGARPAGLDSRTDAARATNLRVRYAQAFRDEHGRLAPYHPETLDLARLWQTAHVLTLSTTTDADHGDGGRVYSDVRLENGTGWPAMARALSKRAVVLSDPGYGKTTLLKAHGLVLLDEAPTALPLLVHCDRLARHLDAHHGDRPPDARQLAVAILDVAFEWARIGLETREREDLIAAIERRQFTPHVLADGLDEVRDSHQKWILQDALRTAAPPHWSILITSRIAGYSRPGADYEEVGICRMRNRQRDRFLKRWLVDGAERPDRYNALANAIDRSADLDELTRIPLLASFCALCAQHGVIPADRAALYESVLKILLRKPWKVGLNPAEALDDIEVEQRLRAAEQVACFMADTDLAGPPPDPEPSFRRISESVSPRDALSAVPASDESHLRALMGSDGLLVPLGISRNPFEESTTQYVWLHRTIHEYLIARSLAARWDDGAAVFDVTRNIVVSRRANPSWEVSINLLAFLLHHANGVTSLTDALLESVEASGDPGLVIRRLVTRLSAIAAGSSEVAERIGPTIRQGFQLGLVSPTELQIVTPDEATEIASRLLKDPQITPECAASALQLVLEQENVRHEDVRAALALQHAWPPNATRRFPAEAIEHAVAEARQGRLDQWKMAEALTDAGVELALGQLADPGTAHREHLAQLLSATGHIEALVALNQLAAAADIQDAITGTIGLFGPASRITSLGAAEDRREELVSTADLRDTSPSVRYALGAACGDLEKPPWGRDPWLDLGLCQQVPYRMLRSSRLDLSSDLAQLVKPRDGARDPMGLIAALRVIANGMRGVGLADRQDLLSALADWVSDLPTLDTKEKEPYEPGIDSLADALRQASTTGSHLEIAQALLPSAREPVAHRLVGALWESLGSRTQLPEGLERLLRDAMDEGKTYSAEAFAILFVAEWPDSIVYDHLEVAAAERPGLALQLLLRPDRWTNELGRTHWPTLTMLTENLLSTVPVAPA